MTAALTDAQFLALLAAVCVVSLFIGAGLATLVICWPAMGPEDESEPYELPYGDIPNVGGRDE